MLLLYFKARGGLFAPRFFFLKKSSFSPALQKQLSQRILVPRASRLLSLFLVITCSIDFFFFFNFYCFYKHNADLLT